MGLRFLTENCNRYRSKNLPTSTWDVKAIVVCCGECAKTADEHVASVPALPYVQLRAGGAGANSDFGSRRPAVVS